MFAPRVLLLLVVLLYMECCYTASIPTGYDSRGNEEIIVKRPFCNAFTGCGRKRSAEGPSMPLQELRQRQELRGYKRSDAVKRFCNIFGGCGSISRRSMDVPLQDLKQFVDEESLGSALDSQQTIDELSRQILSEAKLWEAIQEASAEIARRKQKEIINYQ